MNCKSINWNVIRQQISEEKEKKKKNRLHIGVGRTDRNNDGNDLEKK